MNDILFKASGKPMIIEMYIIRYSEIFRDFSCFIDKKDCL